MAIIKCKSKRSIQGLIKKYNLDKRFKYMAFSGELVIGGEFTRECSGCEGSGCGECGYTGKRKTYFPIPVFVPPLNHKGKVNPNELLDD